MCKCPLWMSPVYLPEHVAVLHVCICVIIKHPSLFNEFLSIPVFITSIRQTSPINTAHIPIIDAQNKHVLLLCTVYAWIYCLLSTKQTCVHCYLVVPLFPSKLISIFYIQYTLHKCINTHAFERPFTHKELGHFLSFKDQYTPGTF